MTAAAGRLALLVLGTCAGLAIAELTLRLLPARREVADLRGLHERRADRPWLYGLRPGAEARLPSSAAVRYAVNADGFRDRRYARPKPPGTFRIVVLGDSLAFGYGVAEGDTFPKRLESELNARRPALRIEVLNLGVNGYNPFNEEALFADVGVTYEPDLVLVQFCINDLNDPTLQFDALTGLQLGSIPEAAYPDPKWRRVPAHASSTAARLCRHFRTCSLVAEALRVRALDRATPADLVAAFAPSPGSAQELAWLRARYDGIARAAAAHGARLVVAVFPPGPQLAPRAPTTIQERLVALGGEAGWETIDLLPAFRRVAAGGGAPLFFDVWHPSASGHRVAAQEIAASLACRGLVPATPVPGECAR